MLDKDALNRIRLISHAAETLSKARAELGPAFGRQLARLDRSIRAAMTLCRQVGGPEALHELARLEVVLREIHGEPVARVH